AGSIYTTSVIRPGNFDVRMTQSVRARNALVRVALVPDEDTLFQIRALAHRIAESRSRGVAILIVVDGPQGWTPRWGVQPGVNRSTPAAPPPLSRFEELPDFTLVT